MNIELEAIYFQNFSPLFLSPPHHSLPSSLLAPLLSHSSLMRLLDNDPSMLFLIRHTQQGRPCLNSSLALFFILLLFSDSASLSFSSGLPLSLFLLVFAFSQQIGCSAHQNNIDYQCRPSLVISIVRYQVQLDIMSRLNNGRLLNKPLNVVSQQIQPHLFSPFHIMNVWMRLLKFCLASRIAIMFFFFYGEAVDGCAKCYLTLF